MYLAGAVEGLLEEHPGIEAEAIGPDAWFFISPKKGPQHQQRQCLPALWP
jgi:hypothetical protein